MATRRSGPLPSGARVAEAPSGTHQPEVDAIAAARDRAQGLQRVTAALSRAATADEVLGVVLNELLSAVGADGAVTTMLDEEAGLLRVRGAVGYRADVVSSLREFGLDSPLPLARAVRGAKGVFYASNDAMLADNPGMEQLVKPLRDRAVGAWPLVVADRVIGSVGLSWPTPRSLDDDALSFVDAVAGQLAQAVDRARLYEAEADARRAAEQTASQLAFLAEASRIVAASLDLDETMQRLADIVVPELSDWCAVYLRDDQGQPLPVATSHQDPGRVELVEELQRRWPVRSDAPSGMGRALSTGETQVFEEVSDELLQRLAQDEEHLRMIRSIGFGSGMIVPLRVRGRVLGAIAAANDVQRPFEHRHVGLLEEVAARAAVAATHAQAYAERSAVATGLQHSLLPARLPVVPGLEVAVRYLSAGQGVDVGGDFYDVFAGRPDRWMLAIGDVCGKGVESAAVTGLARHTIRCAALHSRSPRRILADLNTMLLRAEAELAEGDADEPRFCTVCLAVVRPGPDSTAVTVCNAGHPLPRVVRADGRVESAGEPGPLLGVFDTLDLTERTVHLGPGDALVFYTDGITERRNGPAFFEDRMSATLSGLADLPADVLAEQLQHAAATFGDEPPADDMAMVVVRHPPRG